jgi:hypothetical protein
LGINSVSTEAVNGYELGLQIRLASYRDGFRVIGSDPLRYVGVRPTDCLATWGLAGWAEPTSMLGFGPLG